MSAEIRMNTIRRRVARHGVGTKVELERLFKGSRVPQTALHQIMNGKALQPAQNHLAIIESALDRLDGRNGPPSLSKEKAIPETNNLREYDRLRRLLEERLIFDDFEPFARFAGVELKKLCWFRSGSFSFPGAEYVYRQLNDQLDQYLAWKDAGMTDEAQKSNGHTPAAVLNGLNGHAMRMLPVPANVPAKQAGASVEVVISPASYRRSPRDQMIYDRMVQLGAWKPYSIQRKFFLEASGLSELTVQKFFKGDTSPRIATLEMIEAALDQVEEKYPVSEVQSKPVLDSPEPIPEASGQESILQPSTPADESQMLQVSDVESSGKVEQDALVQAAQLLGVSLEDEHFRTYFSAISEAVAKQSRGEVQLVQTKAIVREDRIRWQVTLGDIDLENPS